MAAAAILAGCGGSAHTGSAPAPPSAPKSNRLVDGSRPPYITGLAVNPTDRSLLLATNRGLYGIDADGHHAQAIASRVRAGSRVGAFGERVSSLAYLHAGELLGSGHPNWAERRLPPFLGVIESRDDGASWTAIARVGFSDLHVLVVSGSTVYGYDTVLGGVVASYDAGRTFSERSAPSEAVVLDLAVDPHADRHLLASSESAIFSSPDGGNSWRALTNAAASRLAWTSRGLYRADADRSVLTSSDGGKTWRRVGELPGTPGKLVETAEGTLYAGLTDGSIVTSGDGGSSWKVLFAP